MVRYLVVIGFMIALAGCHAGATYEQRVAISAVLHLDAAAGSGRNDAPHTMPMARAVERYVNVLNDIELDGTTPQFAATMRAHIDAWSAAVAPLEPFGELRGEMHDVLDEIAELDTPEAHAVQEAIDHVWSTWAEVEQAMKDARVPPVE